MADHTGFLGFGAEVVPDDVGADLLDQGGARRLGRLEGDGVGHRRGPGSAVVVLGSSGVEITRRFSLIGMGRVSSTRMLGRMAAWRTSRARRSRHRLTGLAHAPPGAPRATGRGVRRAGRATGSAASYTMRQARRASHAEGAGDSGLFRLIELHAVNAAGDAAVAIALAGTLFFASPGEARGHIALFLGLTMLPFAVVAPLLGPFLDRFSHGRRWAIGSTMALRAFLCWLMADAVASNSIAMYPAALGVLVSSKAYGVARAATVPRLLPSGLTLVKANSRISLAGVVGAAVSAPLAAGAATFGVEWVLRYATVVFAGATILSILLPARPTPPPVSCR